MLRGTKLKTGMADSVAAVMAAVAAYRRRKQIIKNITQISSHSFWCCSTWKMQSYPENICSLLQLASYSNYVLGTDWMFKEKSERV